jgi:uncharacterized membrane protein YphA (DoxX/SURF4 family)
MKKGHKILALVSRLLLGITFVFSGFVKAVDPLGSTYKIQDYLQAFGLGFFDQYALFFSFVLFCLEFVLGMALLLGAAQRFFAWLALVFMSLMTLLTLVIALGNPVSDCGCFGDALQLSNWQTFGKNIILLLLSLVLISFKEPLYKVFGKKTQNDIFCSGRFDHFGRNFTGIGSTNMICAILCGKAQFLLVYSFTYGSQMYKWCAYNHPAGIIFLG